MLLGTHTCRHMLLAGAITYNGQPDFTPQVSEALLFFWETGCRENKRNVLANSSAISATTGQPLSMPGTLLTWNWV